MADRSRTLDIGIGGMDCADCAARVQRAVAGVPGVHSVDVLLGAARAVVRFDPARVHLAGICRAIDAAGYSVLDERRAVAVPLAAVARRALAIFGAIVGAVMVVVVVGEWFGLLGRVTRLVPWPVWLAALAAGGYPIFRNVGRAALRGRVLAHTVMTLGVLAAIAVGEWATAAVMVFFMRVGDLAERFTADRARRAVRDLTTLAPRTARVLRDGAERDVPVAEVRTGEYVIVRPGEQIPVDGVVVDGAATVDQAAVTGESMPVDAGPGARVYAATVARLGTLRVRATHVGRDTTFGRVIRLVEEAETHRADAQRVADRFAGCYLPAVLGVAALTFLIRGDALATAAVLVVACSCSVTLATPIALLASIGAGARRGVLVKGGRYLERLARADVLFIDKTGTLTLGRPRITDVVPLNGVSAAEVLALAASAERYSEHPLAEAVRAAARAQGLALVHPAQFEAIPGQGVRATIDGHRVAVGGRRLVASDPPEVASALEAGGKTVVCVARDGTLIGLLAAADVVRPEVPQALIDLRALGIGRIELLTGDNDRTAAAVAGPLGVPYRAGLLPEDKIAIVRACQAEGHTVVMVGDGVNDAPALAQADVGIAMGAAATDIAIEAAHVTLMREDWTLVPGVVRIARRTMRVVRLNLGFTALFNLVGLTLAALGFLPPVLAAAAQSLPDVGILANSSRLLRQR